MNTLKEWEESKKDFSTFMKDRDCRIDEELYFHFLNVLPPLYGKDSNDFQVSEPMDTRNGKHTYLTFSRIIPEGKGSFPLFLYMGELTRDEFSAL